MNLKSVTLAVLAFVSFGAAAQTGKKVNTEASKIHWVGKKIIGSHEGTVNLKEGTLIFKGSKLAGGNFKVDMTTISSTDLEGKGKERLDGHLKADDFFGVAKYPEAILVFKKITNKGKGLYTISADLTIKDKTNPIEFDLNVGNNTATAKLAVDRTKYGVVYGSKSFVEGIGDKAILDEFELNVTLSF